MDARTWLGLEASHNPNRWVLPVVDGLATHGGFLFGGCGLGAAIEAMEVTTGRPVVWATAQYLSYAMVGSMLDIDVTEVVVGRQLTQARATGHVADREIFTVNAALGSRQYDGGGQWEAMPDVAPPAESPARLHPLRDTDRATITDRLDQRLAVGRPWDGLDGTPGDGAAALWIRLPDLLDTSASTLAILGDYVPFGIGQALGRLGGGNSLDNTLRVVQVQPAEWVLVDVRVHAIHRGFGHGLVHLWAPDGTLMATASQSTIVRHWDDERRAAQAQQGGAEEEDRP